METEAQQDQKKSNAFYQIKSNNAIGAIKDVDTKSRIVTGFYNSYNYFDYSSDVLLPGCCKKSIKERGPSSNAVAKVKHAIGHDLNMLPGAIQVLEEKTIDGITGLYFETKMSETTLGNDTLINYEDKIYDNHSIGFQYVDLKMIERINEREWTKAMDMIVNPKATEGKSVMWLVKEIMLFEGSSVAFGCNDLTPFLGLKSKSPEAFKLNVMSKIITIEKTLKRGTQSDDMMQTLELQMLQLKQVFSDILDLVPEDKKETHVKPLLSKGFADKFLLSK